MPSFCRTVTRILILTAAACAISSAQTNTDGFTPAAIMPGSPAGSYTLGGFDTINFANGYVNFRFPLVTISGRGKASTVLMPNFTMIWKVTPNVSSTNCGQGQTGCSFTYNYTIAPDSGGWAPVLPQWGGGVMVVRSSGQLCNAAVPGNPSYPMWWTTGLTRLTYIAPDQTEMELVDKPTGGTPQSESANSSYNRGTVFVSHDGSSAIFTATQDVLDARSCGTYSGGIAGTLVTKDGVKHTFDGGGHETQIEDPNGNVITLGGSTIVDAIGRQYQIGQSGACTLLTYPGFNGNSRTIKVCHDSLNNLLRTGQSLQAVQSLWSNVIANADLANYNQVFNISNLVSEIDLPDGSAYKFKYDSYGSVARVELPTGGAVEYDYTQVTGYATDPTPVVIVNLSRALVERREYLNVSDSTPSRVSKYNGQTVMDYDGQGNLLAKIVHNVVSAPVTPVTNPTLYEYGLIGTEMETKYYAGDGQTLLRDVVNQWQLRSCGYQSTCGNPAGAPFDPMLTSVTTTENGATRQTIFGYDDYNNINDQKDSDWASGAPGPLLRHIVTYYEPGAYDSLPVYQPGLPSQINIYDGQGNLSALTYYHYDEGSIQDDPGIIGHDSAAGTGDNLRGNLTTKMSWIGGSSYVTETYKYDIAGNLVKATDGAGNATTYDYADGGNAYNNPTTITNAAGQSTHNSYDYYTRKLTASTDPNGVSTLYSYNEPLDRLTQIRRAAGGGAQLESQTNIGYASPTWTVVCNDKASTNDCGYQTQMVYDGFGRKIEDRTMEDGSPRYISTVYGYDALGRMNYQSNPVRVNPKAGEPNDMQGSQTTVFDSLGRVYTVTTSDGNVTTTDYTGNTATVTDPDNRKRKYAYDALGRLTSVVEDPGGFNYATSYTYDVLGDLKTVTQGAQTRSFVYDSLQRLLSSTQPESGTTSYQYDADGNLTWRSDARGSETCYHYDALNRLRKKVYYSGSIAAAQAGNCDAVPSGSFLPTPAVMYTYDNSAAVPYSIGRLTQVTNGLATTNYLAYDPLGRATGSQESIGGQTYTFGYGYDLSGALTSETYPSGRVISTSFNNAGRVSGVSGGYATQQKTYFSNTEYEPNGAPAWFLYGNGLCRSFGYNSRMQLASSADSVAQGAPQGTCFNAGQQPLAITYSWNDPVNSKNNGNLWNTTTYQNGPSFPQAIGYNATFTYDSLNRIKSAADTTGGVTNWFRNFDYDQYGNMWTSSSGGIPVSGLMPQTNLYNGANRRGDANYDPTGNQLTMGGTTLTYDAENRVASVSNLPAYGGGSETYVYDGDGRRVQKAVTGVGTDIYVYDIFGKLIAEYATNPPPGSPCRTCYISTDHLGSTRLVTGDSASIVARHDYVPFGEEIPGGYASRTSEWGATDNVNQKFTGKERDQETGLDYFGARYYGSALGRFTSPDEPLVDQDEEDPQTWNLYSYVRSNPLRKIDPTGNCSQDTNGGFWDADDKGKLIFKDACSGGGPSVTTVDAFGGNEGIAALAAVGAKLGDLHAWTQLGSDAGRVAGSVMAPEASAIANCIVPGGQCDKTNLALATVPFGPSRLARILRRHSAFSTAKNVSRFAKGLDDAAHVESMIKSALDSPSRATAYADGATVIDADLGVTIGTDISGKPTTTIRVVLDNDGNVHSAFPVPQHY